MNEIKQTLQQDADALLKRLQQSRSNGTGVTLSVGDVGVLCEEIEQLKEQIKVYGKMTDCWYWSGADYYVEDPFEYDLTDMDAYEIIELEKYQTTPRVPEYFCKVFEDEDTCEIIAFSDYADAENAIAHNKVIIEGAEP
ncbi:hypothetical protein QE380_000154 [Acinetobacter baylyi]|uniref:Phage protein n=1 Tax=Acinetobacter baylyi TaxID=202950 RepID=A0ABU0URS3_ACIBI|nr:hypothetical protein [Acinetobacter baylyi]MDQ1207231.1 hypothetical protein [Acinetobacter baylyi]MDR6105687.1 hypothetical protein [Acinetobacter baylyi]MDR6187593.1 hypothetical protein [Acinetobacter baylyi]